MAIEESARFYWDDKFERIAIYCTYKNSNQTISNQDSLLESIPFLKANSVNLQQMLEFSFTGIVFIYIHFM